jgi:murein L,D-transpeptidase YcbB/YkuD
MNLLRLAILAFSLCLPAASPGVAAAALTPQQEAAITINLADLLANEPGLPLPVRQRRDGINGYYQEAAGELLWIGTGRMPAFIARIKAAGDDGLDPQAYPAGQLERLATASEGSDARSQATIELFFSAAFLEFASDMKVGRLLPRKIDPNFFLQDKMIDQTGALEQLAASASIAAFFDAWEPQGTDYAGLKLGLAEYRAVADAGGWQSIPLGAALKPGASDPRIPALRARLAITDGSAPPDGADPERYDEALEAVVQGFQARHGLEADGVVGNASIAALNKPVDQRIDEIVAAMERIRWMPDNLGKEYLIVNIAGFDLKWIKGETLYDRMNVVVGKPYTRTPVFSDAIRYLEFNPYWNVPPGIALKEELPNLRKNAAARAAAGFEAVRGGEVIPLTAIDWNQYGPGNFPFQIRQRPGPKNALGQVKFMFPNKFDVYLHDTPSRNLFERAERAFSHGCIRVSRPIDLAEKVLAGVPGWTPQRIKAVLAEGKNTTVNLVERLPIHITYLTAWSENGRLNFRNDIYDQDKKLISALNGRQLIW